MYVNKFKRIIKEGGSSFRYFGFSVALAKIFCIVTDDDIKSIEYKNKAILKYLRKKYTYLIDKYKSFNETTFEPLNSSKLPIWVLWWQGKDQMPELIKACHKSKIEKANGHPVVLLDKDNINEYISLPDYIWGQLESGELRVQHLADIIRIRLIKEHGGLWLDGSIFCTNDIPEDVFRQPLYSLKKNEGTLKYISDNKWTTFLIGGQKNNLLCRFLDDFFIEYCKTGKPFIDYFMFDCAIALAKENIPAVRKSLDSLPFYVNDYNWISDHIYDVCTNEMINIFESSSSIFYKIAWKVEKNKLRDDSLYYYLLKRVEINE